MDTVSYILSKKYTDKVVAGAGALKGKSAYEIACENGFSGSESEWLQTLKGSTPEIGPEGTWIIDGIDTGIVVAPDLGGYATEEFVAKKIAEIELNNEPVDLTGYATEDYVNEVVSNIKFPEAPYSEINVYEITSDSAIIDELILLLPDGVSIHSGDVMLVTNSFGIKSAYQFDETWIACDGNVDASKCIMPFDITLAGSYSQVGNLKKTTNGTATFATRGKSVAAALQEILSKREQPGKPTEPKVSVVLTDGGIALDDSDKDNVCLKEVGSIIIPTWSVKLSAGSYTYGPATGITASEWNIKDSLGNTSVDTSGEFNSFIIDDTTNYYITATAKHADGTVALDNLGDLSNPVVQIIEGTKSGTSMKIKGYRPWFIYINNILEDVDSNLIRRGKQDSITPSSTSLEIPQGTRQVIVAIPANSSQKLTSVIDVDGMGLDVFSNFIQQTVDVYGTNDYDAIPYSVWIAENANGLAKTNYNFIITNKED